MSGFDAVLVVGFGGPEAADEVPGFLQHVSGGHIPAARLAEVSRHYDHFGGSSPANAQNRMLAEAIARRLAKRGLPVPVALAHRHSAPFITDVLAQLAGQGHRRVLTVISSPYASYASCRAYREELFAALPRDEQGHSRLQVANLTPFADLPALADAEAQLLQAELARHPDAHLVFTTHSIPTAMARASGPTGEAYVTQHQQLIGEVLARLAQAGYTPCWRLAYQSRSGSPETPWLEPDINQLLNQLAADGVSQVICCPMGFLSDHMEVAWDLDVQAADTARRLGMDFIRVPTAGEQPVFLDGLSDRIAATLRRPVQASPDGWCVGECCVLDPPKPVVEGVSP